MTTIKRTKDRQYHDHNEKDEEQTIPWPQWKGRRTDNTMTTIKRTKDRQYHSFSLWSLYCLSFVRFIVVIVLSVLRPFYCGHCIVCTSSLLLWSLHGLSFVLKDIQYNDHNEKDEGRTIQWPQWNGRSTDNTMITIKRTKDIQYNDLLWSLYCLSFVLFIVVIVLSVLRPFHCGHCIVCPSTIKRTKDRQYNDHNKKDEGQTIQWPQ
jgi:lipopolysaccharide/colanic/teichoic acid biosynthesis glycosyltransferase